MTTGETSGAILFSLLVVVSMAGGSIAASGVAVADESSIQTGPGESSRVSATTDVQGTTAQVEISPSDLEGSGTETDPYIITNASELQAIEGDLTANYTLGSDIDASATADWNGGSGFDPIGGTPFDENESGFAGSLDGDNHTITGLTINRPSENTTALLGGNEGKVSDITLTDANITGARYIGGLVGINAGLIQNATVSGDVSSTGYTVGGLSGSNYGKINHSRSAVTVTGPSTVGGFVGYNEGLIENGTASAAVSSPDGSFVGGLVGTNTNGAKIDESRATGPVNSSSTVGGLVGGNYYNSTIANSTAGGTVRGDDRFVGGAVGVNLESTVDNTTASGAVTGSDDVGGLVGGNFDGVVVAATASGAVDGSKNNIGGLVGRSSGKISDTTASGDVAGSDTVGGLVGDNNGVVANSNASGNVSGSEVVGGLAGSSYGTIKNTAASGNVDAFASVGGSVGSNYGLVLNTTASGSVNGSDRVGGLVGKQYGLVANASSSGSVSGSDDVGGLVGTNRGAIKAANASSDVTGSSEVGGLLGVNEGSVETVRASGNVTGSDRIGGLVGSNDYNIANAFATGTVRGSTDIGGFAGVSTGTESYSYWDEEATNQSTSAGTAINLTTAEMTGVAASDSMFGLGFGSTWQTQSEDYPVLTGALPTPSSTENVNLTYDGVGTGSSGSSSGPGSDTAFAENIQVGSENETGFRFGGSTGRSIRVVEPRTGESLTIRPEENLIGDLSIAEVAIADVYESEGPLRAQPSVQLQLANGGFVNGVGVSTEGNDTMFEPRGDDSNPFEAYKVQLVDQNGSVITETESEIHGIGYRANASQNSTTGDIRVSVTRHPAVNESWNVRYEVDTGSEEIIRDVENNPGDDRFTVTINAAPLPEGEFTHSIGIYESGTQLDQRINSLFFIDDLRINSSVQNSAPYIIAPRNTEYDSSIPFTLGTSHNATGEINSSDVAIRLVNATDGNNTVVAVNDSVPVEGDVNTTIPAGSLDGNVTIRTQLYNNSTQDAAANDTVTLTAVTPNDGDSESTQVDVAPSELPGDGTQSNPYEISNASELQAMEDDLSANYTLVSDIDASNTAQWNNGSGFDPIGGGNAGPFTGALIGNESAINGLTINRASESAIGLFGYVGTEGSVSGVALVDTNVTGDSQVGSVAGENEGTIVGVSASGTVQSDASEVGGLVGANTGGTIESSTTSVTVTVGGNTVGGLAGSNDGTISTSFASGNVTGSSSVGGLVGTNGARVEESGAESGTVSGDSQVGGLIGENGGTIRLSVANGTVTGSGDDLGGLVGKNDRRIEVTVANVTVIGEESSRVGGLVGSNNGGTVSSSFAGGSVVGLQNVGGLIGLNTNSGTISLSEATADVRGESNLGGFVGANNATIENTSATGRVNGSSGNVGGLIGLNRDSGSVSTSYAVGSVETDSGSVGGFIGSTETGSTVADSYWDTITTGQDTSAGGAQGLTTDEMTGESAQTNMTGFDFEATWRTTSSYPELRIGATDGTDAGPGGDAGPFIIAPPDSPYDPTAPFTIGTGHNASGVIDDRDVAIRLVNVTDGNDTAVALNDSVPVAGNVNTTIPSGSLSGDVTIETQLYNTSSQEVVTSDILNLTVEDELGRERLNLTANQTTIDRGETIEFTVTNSSGASVENATVVLPGFEDGVQTAEDGTVTVTPTTVGQLSAFAFKQTDEIEFEPDGVEFTVDEPTLTVSEPDSTGTVTLGESAQIQVTLTNNESVPIEPEPVAVVDDRADVFSVGTVPDAVPAGENTTINVTFAPVARGTAAATLRVGDSAVGLTGTGVAPTIDVTSDLPVEVTAQTGESVNTTVTVRNNGNTALNATLTTNHDAFSQPDRLNVSANSTASFNVTFEPTQSDAGTVSTGLTIGTETAVVPNRTVPVVGTVEQRDIRLGRSNIAVGNVTVGESTTSAVIVENVGTTVETLTATTDNANLSLAADDAGNFTLGPGDRERLTLETNATTTGDIQGTLTVGNATDPALANDSAVVTARAQAPNLTVAATEPVLFSDTPVNSTATVDIELENDGTAPLRVSLDDAFNETEASNFSVVSSPEITIPASETQNVTVGFSPETAGDTTATLTLDTNDIDADAETENVTLAAVGTETNVTASTSSVAFGTVGLGDTTTETLTITNDGTDFTVDSVSVTGAAGFSQSSAVSGTVVSGGDTQTVELEFAPEATGVRTGTVNITGTAGSNTTSVTVALTGTGRDAQLQLGQNSIRTGVTTTDEITTGSIAISNTGTDGTTLTVDNLTLADSDQFSINTSRGLAEGDTVTDQGSPIAVTFSPDAATEDGEQRTQLTLNASGEDREFSRTISVVGIVSAPEPVASTDGLSLGTIETGEPVRRTVTVSNDGGEPFTIQDVSADDSDVRVQQIGRSEVVPGGESVVAIEVNRTTTGPFATTVTVVPEDGTVENLSVPVTGDATAPDLTVTAGSATFSDTAVGSAGSRDIRIQNTGNATLTIDRPSIQADSDRNESAFNILTGDRTVNIAPGNSRNVTIGFEPSSNDSFAAMLRLEQRDALNNAVAEVDINGTGVEANAALNNSAVSFGATGQDETRTRSLRLTNDGNAPLAVTGNSITGSDPGAFSVNALGRPTLAPGESETFTVTVNTADADRGGLTGQLDITTNDTTVTSQLSTTVSEPDVQAVGSISDDTFGTTRLGTTTTAELRINNTGNADLNVTDLSVTGTDAAAFSVVEPTNTSANTTIASESSQRVVVEFDPAAASNATDRALNTPLDATARLNVSNNDPAAADQELSIELNGEGETPALDVPRTFQFGDTPAGETTTGQITVQNTVSGTAPLNLTTIEVTGRDSEDYDASLNGSDTPSSLTPGESATVDVNLTPTSFDQKFATLSIETNDTRQPVKKIGLSNSETTFTVDYGSVNVSYINPDDATQEPTVNVDEGLQGRNATLRTVNSNVSSTTDYTLNFTTDDSAAAFGQSELSNDTITGKNTTTTPFRYINATTSADERNFTESTFRVTVSKAVLAEQNVTPGNVTIYHENTSSGYDQLETELLFETSRGYVYEATTENYSVFTVGGTPDSAFTGDDSDDSDGTDETEDPDNTDETENIDDTDSSDSSSRSDTDDEEAITDVDDTTSTPEPEDDTTEKSAPTDTSDSSSATGTVSDATTDTPTSTPTPVPTTGTGTPGFGTGITVIAILLTALTAIRRRR